MITTNHLEKKLQSLTLGDHGNSVIFLVDAIEDLRLKIEADKERGYDERAHLTLVFEKVNAYSQPGFQFGLLSAKNSWKDENKTMAEVLQALRRLKTDTKAENKCGALDPAKEQVIALTSCVQQL